MWRKYSNTCNFLYYSPNSSELSPNRGKSMSDIGESATYGDEESDSMSGLERDEGLRAALGIFIPSSHAERQISSGRIESC